MIRLVLYQPQIPQNVGALLRLSACWNILLECVGPFPFLWSDKHLRRAGLDYIASAQYVQYSSWDAYQETVDYAERHIVLTTQASVSFLQFSFKDTDRILLGSENGGVPNYIIEKMDACLYIPMEKGRRSLNMSMSAAIVLTEALRQIQGFPP